MSHEVTLNWITPNAEQVVVDDARISNPGSEGKPPHTLIGYLLRNQHWSPFEMVNMSVKVETTRDIGRQLLRHWTLRPQEFSQRYADIRVIAEEGVLRECRMQDSVNRQSSHKTDDEDLAEWWRTAQQDVWNVATHVYGAALERGIAKEVARVVMPEGMTPTVMKFNGNLRSWIHFYNLRSGHGTQSEATQIAIQIGDLIEAHFPHTFRAMKELRDANH